MSDTGTQTRWELVFPDGTRLRNRQVSRAHSVGPHLIEEAIGRATCRPGPHTKEFVVGRDAGGRLVVSFISELHRFHGDARSAAEWLSGAPWGEWQEIQVNVNTPGTAR